VNEADLLSHLDGLMSLRRRYLDDPCECCSCTPRDDIVDQLDSLIAHVDAALLESA
jgi:hypothetical protein